MRRRPRLAAQDLERTLDERRFEGVAIRIQTRRTRRKRETGREQEHRHETEAADERLSRHHGPVGVRRDPETCAARDGRAGLGERVCGEVVDVALAARAAADAIVAVHQLPRGVTGRIDADSQRHEGKTRCARDRYQGVAAGAGGGT